MELRPQTVAAFFAEYKGVLAELGVAVKIHPMPVELAAPVRFDLDETHRSYDRDAVERFRRVLMLSDTLFKRFRPISWARSARCTSPGGASICA